MARRVSRRIRRIWGATAASVLGLLVLGGIGWWIERSRDTDRQDPTLGVTQEFRGESPAAAPTLRFVDVTGALGITASHGRGPRARTLPEDTGSGLAWGDYDGDGDDDLYLVDLAVGAAARDGNRLYRNDQDRFVDVTERAGVGDPHGFGMGASFVDLDGDGDLDLYVTNHGPNRLFVNRGEGTFGEEAAERGLADPRWSVGAAWGDFDRDGRVDLYVANYVEFDAGAGVGVTGSDPNWEGVPFTLNPNAFDPQPNGLYLQRANGTFVDEAIERGVSDPGGRSLSVTALDLDGDGWLDLYVANDVSPNALFRSRGAELGDAIFEEIGSRTGTADPRGSMGVSVADLAVGGPADGRPDLFITHWVAQENALYQAVELDGRLEYRDRVRPLRLAEISTDRVGWGCGFADLDLDGRLDLVVANGSTLEADPAHLQAQAPFVFWNGGDRFYDVTEASGDGVATPRVARGLALSDFDLDGDPDVAVSVNRGPPVLWRLQSSNGRGWMAARLDLPAEVGSGARLERRRARERVDTRWHRADVSFASGHSAEHLFGLGEEARSSLVLRSLDGGLTRWKDLAGGERYVLRPRPWGPRSK